MCGDGDSSLVVQTSSNNTLKNNEVAHISTELLSQINLKCKIEGERSLPLIFSGIRDSIELIRCDNGEKIAEIEKSNIKYIKWYIPAKYLGVFGECDQEEQFGIITVDSSNNLEFYPEIFDQIEIKENIVGVNTSYFRDLDGNVKLSVIIVESNGNITKWIPFDESKLISKNAVKKRVQFISDTNLVLELNNTRVTSRCNDKDCNAGKSSQISSNKVEDYLKLNKKLFLSTGDQVCVVDTENLELLRTISTTGSIRSIFPYFRDQERILVVSKAIEVFEMEKCECVYKYDHDLDEFSDYESINVGEVVNARVELNDPGLLIVSTKYNRVYLLNTANSVIASVIGISTSRLYVYYYVEHGEGGNATNVKYGLVAEYENSLVGFDVFKLSLLYSRMALPNKIEVMANSQLMPNLLLASSSKDLLQLDLHFSHQGGVRSATKTNANSGSRLSSDYYKSLDRNTSKILINNLATIKHLNNTSISASTNTPTGTTKTANKTVTCITFHPRLPNICSVGHSDGSLYLLFIEHENRSLFNYVFIQRFKDPVKKLVWYLVPKSLNYTNEHDGDSSNAENIANKWSKKGCSNFMERVCKSINSSKYASILLLQLDIYQHTERRRPIGDYSSVYYMKLGENRVYSLPASILSGNLDATEHGSNRRLSSRLFSIFIIQHPPPNCADDGGETEECNDGDGRSMGYNNFSVVYDYVCLAHYSENSVTLTLVAIDLGLNATVVKRFKTRVKGAVTNVVVTSKQYNQYHLYADSYLEKTSRDGVSEGAVDTVPVDGDFSRRTADATRFDKCVNSMQQYLVISTNLGRIYVTSLLKVYNNFLLEAYATHDPSHEEALRMDETFIGSGNITHLDHTILYSPLGFPPSEAGEGTKGNCLCGSNCHFILVVGMNGLILFYALEAEHRRDRFKLTPFHVMRASYNSFLVINEPFHYFKLLVNASSGISQHYFNYTQIIAFLSKHRTHSAGKVSTAS
ncbi:uncharacterized protein TOT_030000642 [Theileria orientalis strain Shintoku]|uniref:Uncharacterized protein n=1 Tax=Theileria orientalis strain Shintoku TaxID=869250 RepID=J4D9H1_THEOR|nr:uncharacterized protein TOT_030000642 [Theileria orientalis strain Shintoku]BAM41380.1 uncharacterized protein TOT_030000642 [Theileria orientalis strain Shintoku]|eukprot:XP_009691681.1 uncharacterized protein TOT_030000642 [Theileria orientalis strain Shintoku]